MTRISPIDRTDSETTPIKKNHLVSNKENIDTSTPTGKLMLTMIGAINEFERTNLLEQRREGIALAVKEGKYRGCKKEIPDFEKHYARYKNREINKVQLAAELNISRPTLDKLINNIISQRESIL